LFTDWQSGRAIIEAHFDQSIDKPSAACIRNIDIFVQCRK